MSASDDDKNKRIRARELRLFGEDGTYLGIVPTSEALKIAKEQGLELFVSEPSAAPPVAKITSYGRLKFEQEKKLRVTKRKHHMIAVKEIKLRYQIEEHDYQVKFKQAQKFLEDGDKIEVLMILRGREVQHKDLAQKLMNRFAEELQEISVVDIEPKVDGKSVLMVLSPSLR